MPSVTFQHSKVGAEPFLGAVSLHQDDLGIRELFVDDAPEGAGGLINNNINLTVHFQKYFFSNVSVKEIQILVQIILEVLFKVVNIVAQLSESIGHGLCASFGETCTDYFHFYLNSSEQATPQSSAVQFLTGSSAVVDIQNLFCFTREGGREGGREGFKALY